jgi:hypothetical protein
VVSAVMMALASLQRPAFEAATPRIVPLEQITAASALLSMSRTSACWSARRSAACSRSRPARGRRGG